MLCCYVKSSGVPSSGKTWIALIASVGPMLRSMCQIGQVGENPWITQAGNHGIVKTIKLVYVATHVTMNLMEKFTNIFAHFVWLGGRQLGNPEKECPHRKQNLKKRTCSCPSLRCRSCREGGSGGRKRSVTQITGVTGVADDASVVAGDSLDGKTRKMYNTRFFYNCRVVPLKVDALLARKHHRGEILGLDIVRSRVFSRVSELGLHTFSQVAPKCTTISDAGQSVSSKNHNDLSHPTVHSKRSVNDISIGNDLEVVQSSLLNTSAKSNTPGFEYTGPGFESMGPGFEPNDPGFESPTAGHDYDHPMDQQSSPVFESQEVLVAETSGPWLESPKKLISLCTQYLKIQVNAVSKKSALKVPLV